MKKKAKIFFCLRKQKNEKEIAELFDKGKDLNVLYKSSTNLKEILNESPVHCENCKDAYEPNAILKHIGNNKECKNFYGPSFDKFKLEKERLRIKKFQLAKQKENYATDPKVQENKRVSNTKTYQAIKDKKAAMKEKRRIEYQKERCQTNIPIQEKGGQRIKFSVEENITVVN